MPIYTVKASDGNLYKVDAPEGTTQEQVFAFVSSQMAMRQRAPESAGFNLGDLAASFAQGAYGSTQALTDVFGAGNVASQALEERARASQAGMSVARQAELARQQERLKRAEASGSTLEEIKAAVQNVAEAPLQSAAQALGSFVPYLPTMFLGPAARVLALGDRAKNAATAVAKAAPAVIGTAQGAGAVKGAIYDAVYEAERKDGVGEEEARAKAEAAQSYAGNNIDQILLGSGAGYVAGRFGAERLLTPGAAAKASQSVAGRIATAAATDVPTEAFQGGQERLAANLALQREGRDVPTFEGVAGQATQEGLLGLLGSAPVAALRGPDVEALRQEAIKKQQAEFEAEKARALAEMAARPPEPEKPIELPQGYKVMREELGRDVGPMSYGIFVEGQETPLTTVASEQQALQKIESFKEIRESERENLVEQMEKLNDGIQKTRDRIDYLEATGKTADPEYTKLTTALPDQELTAETKARELAEQVQQLGAPLTFAPIGQKETVREQYNVLSPTNEPIGTFATAGEAEASVRGIIGDEPFKQAEMKKERDERIVALEQQLVPKLKQFGLQDVGLKVVESIENNAGGAYLNKLIRVAYDEANPLQTMRHESLHALKDLGFFTPQQWKALNERAEKQWVQELKNVPFSEGKSRHDAYVEMFTQEGEAKGLTGQQLQNYVRETLNEEAIADAFGAYDRGATPPPGMIAALFKRLKNFFLNLGQALRGAGFESADDIFQRVERGELRGRKPAEAEEKLSLIRAATPEEIEISTQNPSGPKRAYDPITQMLSIDEKAVMEVMKVNPDYQKATIKAIKGYGFIPDGTKDKDAIPLFKQNIVNNLLYLYNLVPEDIRQRSKLWYDGANKISQEMADKYGLSLRQVSAIMAAMSPQKDWFQNVSMGERAIDILTKHGDRSWSPEMLQYAESYVKESKDRAEREKRQDDFEKIKKVAEKGTALKDMDIKSAAAFIRAFDEAFHSRQYRIVTPEGGFGDIVRNNDGTPSTMMWSTYGPIEKAVSIFRDGSRENISEQLGFEHKIRSFYNNIAAPKSDLEHVTIDTHAVAAALFEALAGTDPEVVQNFGGTGKSRVVGVGGTYGLIADAYRDAAKQVGVLPREMQSITWEAVRGLFNEDIKNSIKEPVKAEWAKYKSGKQSFEETRRNIIEISRNKRTSDKNVDIPPPDWVGSGEGQFVEDGGESYNKDYIPEGGVRLRAEQEIRDKLTFNLSAVTNSIPGLRELYSRALKRDEKAIEVLQGVAQSSLTHLLSGTNARVNIERAKGVYLSDREPSLMVTAAFNESEGKDVLAALARFANNFNQEQIHVRMGTKKNVGFDYGDGSYVTPVYTIQLKKELSDKDISNIIDTSGLKGFTVTKDNLIAYFVKPNRESGETNEQYAKRVAEAFDQFEEQVNSAYVLAGKKGTTLGRKNQRLFVYGSGYGATVGYESISGDVRPEQSADTVTPRLIAEYLTGEPVQVFKQKDLTKAQVAQQEKLAQAFDTLPVNDLKNPLVKKAYKALTKALKDQFAVLPIKVEIQTGRDVKGNIIPPYNNNSQRMRRDILESNHMLVYPTTPETFGPEGYDFSGHPLLEDSGFKDINGKPMLYNDVLRAVHDYFAHGMTEAQFGPAGEYTAWKNHMASTPDPMARWALTTETRLQNAWQNFRPEVAELALRDRPFALQKAALPPIEFVFTGDKNVDAPVIAMAESLSDKDRQGSKPTAKLSLKAPTTPAFKQWFGDSKVVDKNGDPLMVYHGTGDDFAKFKYNELKALGSWFAAGPQLASQYSEIVSRGGKSPLVMPVYLSLQNPASEQDLQKATEQAEKEKDRDFGKINKRRREILQAQGFDGVLLPDSFVVFEPTQIKSAIGNVGAYGQRPITKKEAEAFGMTVEEANEAQKQGDIRFSLKAPTSTAFKQWFGDSTVVNEDGTPKVMYHGLAKDTTDFTRKTARGAPIFLTDDPEFAAQFSADSYESVARNPQEYLSKEQIDAGVKRAIAAIKKDYGKDSLGKEMVESLQTGDLKDATPEAREYIQKEFISLLPTGPHIMPLYVRAERPFDYENSVHVRKVVNMVKSQQFSSMLPLGDGRMVNVKDLSAVLGEGNWQVIEAEDLQEAIKAVGFDSFYVKEHGRKNLAVYDPNQVKSATGNVGTFSRESPDVRYSLKQVKEIFNRAEEIPMPAGVESIRDQWIGGVSGIGDRDAMYDLYRVNGSKKYIQDVQDFVRKELGDQFKGYRLMSNDELEELKTGAMGSQFASFTLNPDVARAFKNIPAYSKKSGMSVVEMDLTPEHVNMIGHPGELELVIDYGQGYNPSEIKVIEKYSLKNVAFPSAKEAQEAADARQAPNTKEFKLFIGASRWLDEDGNPKKFFHATAGNFFEFLEGRIYLSETAKDSEKYGYGAEDRLRASIYRALNKDEKLPLFQRAVDEAVKEGKITAEDGNEFMRQVKRKIPDFGKYNAIKEEVDAELIALSPERMKIMPLYARSETPFDFRNSEHVYQVSSIVDRGDVRLSEEAIQEARRLGVPSEYPDQWYRGLPGLIKQGYPKTIESPQVQKAIRKLGFDGYIVRHNRNAPLTYVVYDNNQVKSVTGNLGDYSLETKDIRYSLPAIPKAMDQRIGETTFRREPERFFERITEAISPKNFSYFRQRVLNQYNQLSVYDKKLVEQMGGKELLADQSAEAAALMSDLGAGVAASAMGFGDRNGGIPVYKNGVTTIDRSKKGLIAVLQPLARYGDPKIYQYYQYWAMVKRGVRLNAEGRETGIDNTDVQYAKYLQDKFPEFVTVQKEFIEFNNGLVKYARDTGVISEQNAEAFMRYADYVPFYRQMDGETTVGPNIFQSIAGVKPPKKLKGGTAPLADFLETAVRNTQSMIQAGVKNAAAQRAVGVVTKVKAPGMGAERLDYDANGPDVFHVLENGKRVSYRTPDVLLIDAISSLHLNEIPGLGIVAAPANALRNLVTKDPGFMMANLMRDSLSAWVTSGQKMTPIAGTVINFGKALAKKSKGYEALLDAGVIGGYEFSQNIERSGRQLEEDLSEKAGKKAPLVLRPFKSLWGALERGTEASDAATRALVYERVLNDTGNEAEALFRALEVMNFNRKGNSPLIRILTAGVPFLNARMQGLDLFYRASTGNMNMADKAAIQRKFWLRGSTMMAISAYYWMMVHDEDDYKSQEQETKDNNWIIPSLGIRIPIPFEVGVLFKTIPERIMAYSFGNDTGKDFTESMKRNFMSTFAFNPIPQVVKPVLEAAFNFNPFTWRQIVGQGMQDVAVEYQVGPGTSKIAKAIGENLGLSPMKVDHIIKGYTGTMGMYAIDTIDYIMDQFGDSPKAAKRFEQMPVIKRFAVDPAARGTVTAYYELKDSVDTTVRTMNLLERTMEPEKFAQYVQDNLGPLAVKDYIRDLERTMKELREMRIVIQSSTMSAEEKRDGLLTINQAENNLTKNIQEVKKAIASLK